MLSESAREAIAGFMDNLRQVEDVKVATLRNYESDLRHFVFWLETTWDEGGEPVRFSPQRVTTPTLTQYRAHMQQVARLKPATINRRLVALKRHFRWAAEQGLTPRSPAAPVRLLPMVPPTPRLLAPARDRALLVMMLHTGLRAQEVCDLALADIRLTKKDGWLTVQSGKRSKWREVPLNGTVRDALAEYLRGLGEGASHLLRNPCLGRATAWIMRR